MSTFIIADATNNITISQDGVIIETIAKEAVVLQIVLSGEALNKSNVDELWIQHDGKYSTEIPYTSATVVSDTPSSVEDFRQKVLVLLNANAIYTGGGAPSFPIEITRATAITMNAANGGNGSFIDGQLYRITNPASPLTSVVLRAQKDHAGNPRLAPTGIGNIATLIGYTDVEVGYNPFTNAIAYIYEPVQNVRLMGSSPYSTFPWGHTNYHDLDFTDLTLSINDFDLCQISHTDGIGCTLVLVNSKVDGCEFEYGSAINFSGTASSASYITKSRVLAGASLTLANDSTVTESFVNVGFTVVDYGVMNSHYVGCTLASFTNDLSEVADLVFTRCQFGGGYSFNPSRNFTDVNFAKGFYSIEGAVSQSGTDDPTIVLHINDFVATEASYARDGVGKYTIEFDLSSGQFVDGKTYVFMNGSMIDVDGTVIGHVAAKVAGSNKIKITTFTINSDGTFNPTDGLLVGEPFQIIKYLNQA